jgi:hypothetical protein
VQDGIDRSLGHVHDLSFLKLLDDGIAVMLSALEDVEYAELEHTLT